MSDELKKEKNERLIYMLLELKEYQGRELRINPYGDLDIAKELRPRLGWFEIPEPGAVVLADYIKELEDKVAAK